MSDLSELSRLDIAREKYFARQQENMNARIDAGQRRGIPGGFMLRQRVTSVLFGPGVVTLGDNALTLSDTHLRVEFDTGETYYVEPKDVV